MNTSDEFKKFIIKQIKKTDLYKIKKKQIGKITTLNFIHSQTQVMRSDVGEYCEYSDFLCRINNAETITFRLFTDGTMELID